MSLDLKQLRKKSKLTLQEVADTLGVTKSTVFKWESRNTNLKGKHLFNIASLYNVSPDSLISTTSESKGLHTLPYKLVPLIYPQKGVYLLDVLHEEFINMKNKKIMCPFECGDRCFVVKHTGDGMLKDNGEGIKNGAFLFCDPDQAYTNQDIVYAYLSKTDEYVCLKYIQQYGVNMLVPLNNRYPAIEKDFDIVGKIIAELNKL